MEKRTAKVRMNGWMDKNILENGKMEKEMGEGNGHLERGIFIWGTGKTEKQQDRDNSSQKMMVRIGENLRISSSMDMGNIIYRTEIFMWENFGRDILMERESTYGGMDWCMKEHSMTQWEKERDIYTESKFLNLMEILKTIFHMASVDAELQMEIYSQASTAMGIDLDMGITKKGI